MSLGYKSFNFIRRLPLISNLRYIHIAKKIIHRDSEQIDYLKSALFLKDIDWNTIKNSTLSKPGIINQKNIDAIILKITTANKNYAAALSFANFLKTSCDELSLGVTNGLLHFYTDYAKQNNLTEEEKLFILDTYKRVHEKYKILDYSTNEILLHALCAIDEWEKCMKLLEDISLTSKPSHSAYSTLIGTLFKNNKKIQATKLIQISLNNERALQHYAYKEWIKYLLREYKDKNSILNYLNEICLHFANNNIVVPEATTRLFHDTYKSLGWSTNYTTISKQSGKCSSCNHTLDCLKLTQQEFNLLQSNVKDKLIVGSDLFLKTSPDELARFLDFVEKTKPYDIVIDGLNVAYAFGTNQKDKTKILCAVVNTFSQQNKKILLLGRKHMLGWGKGFIQFLSKKTCSFFTNDLSQDDPYFITAALLSGSHTDIVSKDLLRGHRFMLKDENLKLIFQRWQWQHQWMVFGMRQKAHIQPPLQFTPCAQKNNNGWHLPYEKERQNTVQVNDGVPDCSTWLCLMPKD